jgi:phosphatidylglycerophosphatase A
MSTSPVSPSSILKNPIHFLAFGFGSGLSPVAPGTFGTLAAVPIYLALIYSVNSVVYLLVVVLLSLLGFWLCGKTAKDLGVHDHPGIVWDEIVGFLITMYMAPLGWVWIIVGFALFRVFDILKPWPIHILDEKVEGGVGIMVDDILAGIYAWIVLQIIVNSTM